MLNGVGVQVYWCPIKDDLAKIYENEGKDGILKTLKGIKIMNTKTIMSLKMMENNLKETEDFLDKKEFQRDWEMIKRAQQHE